MYCSFVCEVIRRNLAAILLFCVCWIWNEKISMKTCWSVNDVCEVSCRSLVAIYTVESWFYWSVSVWFGMKRYQWKPVDWLKISVKYLKSLAGVNMTQKLILLVCLFWIWKEKISMKTSWSVNVCEIIWRNLAAIGTVESWFCCSVSVSFEMIRCL